MKRYVSITVIAMLLVGLMSIIPAGKIDVQAYTPFEETGIKNVIITAPALNVRSGNSTGFPVVNKVYKNQQIEVIGKLGNWYAVHLPDNTVGVIASWYTKPYNTQPPSYYNSIQKSDVDRVVITASALNVRSGNSTVFPVVNKVYNNQQIEVIGRLGNWYVVHLPDDTVGAVASWYTKPYAASQPPSGDTSYATQEEQYMLDLINKERTSMGLKPLKMDKDLVKLSRLKSKDMIENNYFDHYSPTYGSPFDMMRDFGIQYKYAGENIAGNRSVEAAHQGLMNSSGHRANILKPEYNYIGIGIVDGGPYGKMFTQMFVGR